METQVAKELIPLIHDTFESLKNYDEKEVSRNPAPGEMVSQGDHWSFNRFSGK